jgi:predicted house-cleaning noncanonical NTP pyrophosphatase (MazG superfamily)
MKTRPNKLVRDRIPEILAARGIKHEVRVADRGERLDLLQAKIEEELAEYLAATDDEARLGELADVWEVILALAMLHGADLDSLERLRAHKAMERGTFDAGIVLTSIGSDEL